MGREAGSPLRLLENKTTLPQPLPLKEGALPTPARPWAERGVQAEGGSFRAMHRARLGTPSLWSHTMPQLATRFSRNTNVVRSGSPLGEEQMRLAAPSIFAAGKHVSRSERYAYIPTIEVLRGLQKEGFQPFMVAQGKSRTEGKSGIHQAHDPHASRRPGRGTRRGERDHPHQQPRWRELVPDARRRVSLRLLQRPGGRRRLQRHSHPAQGQRPRRGDRRRIPSARRLRGGGRLDRRHEGHHVEAGGAARVRDGRADASLR